MLVFQCQQDLWLAGPQNHKYHRAQIYDHNKARNITIHNLSLNRETNTEWFTKKNGWNVCVATTAKMNQAIHQYSNYVDTANINY